MFLEEKALMNIYIKYIKNWINFSPKRKQWMWFVILWCGGLFSVLAVSYPIKLLIKSMG